MEIRLTNRPPVIIEETEWPIIASKTVNTPADDLERQFRWSLTVRQHADGRAIVYAQYTFTSQFAQENLHANYSGCLLSSPVSPIHLAKTISHVAVECGMQVHHKSDATRWLSLISSCIADLPAEII